MLPGDVDDATVPSGGNAYDRRVCHGLGAIGWRVHEILVPGSWPRPAARAREALARAITALPDGAVVLLDGLVACGVPDVLVPAARRLRLAALVHLPLADETGLAPAEAADLDGRERETLHAVHAVVATSRWAARRLVEHHALERTRVHVVAPGADPAPVAPGTDGASGLLCVASVTPRKGHDLLVESLARVADLTWSCTCVGPCGRDPEHVARLRRLIDQRGLADRVRLTGAWTGERLAAAYAAADLMVLSSRAETYGMVVTEALARGIPVLATSVGGVPDTLGRTPDGEVPGLLVPPADPAALADALRRWLSSDQLRHRLRLAAGRRRARLERWTETSARMADILAALRMSPL